MPNEVQINCIVTYFPPQSTLTMNSAIHFFHFWYKIFKRTSAEEEEIDNLQDIIECSLTLPLDCSHEIKNLLTFIFRANTETSPSYDNSWPAFYGLEEHLGFSQVHVKKSSGLKTRKHWFQLMVSTLLIIKLNQLCDSSRLVPSLEVRYRDLPLLSYRVIMRTMWIKNIKIILK